MIQSTVKDINSRISTPKQSLDGSIKQSVGSMMEVRAQRIHKNPGSIMETNKYATEARVKKIREIRAKAANSGSVMEIRESKPLVRN